MDILAPEPGSFTIMDRGFLDFARLHRLDPGLRVLRDPRQAQHGVSARLFPRCRSDDGSSLRPDHQAHRRKNRPRLSAASAPSGFQHDNDKRLAFLTNNFDLPALDHCTTLQVPLAGGAVFQMDQAAPAHQGFSAPRKMPSKPKSGSRLRRLRARRHHQKAPGRTSIALHNFANSQSHTL